MAKICVYAGFKLRPNTTHGGRHDESDRTMTPMPGQMPQSPEMPEESEPERESPDTGEGETITVVCKPDGTYLVNGESFSDLEDALRKIVQICQDGQGEATKEQDYQAGFKKTAGMEV